MDWIFAVLFTVSFPFVRADQSSLASSGRWGAACVLRPGLFAIKWMSPLCKIAMV